MPEKVNRTDPDLVAPQLAPARIESPSSTDRSEVPAPGTTEVACDVVPEAAPISARRRLYLPLQAKFAIALAASVLWAWMAATVA